MNSIQGDIGEEMHCQDICTRDASCKGYNYAYPICTTYGTVRNGPDLVNWYPAVPSFIPGDRPPALVINRVLVQAAGEPKFVCRKKDLYGDPDISQLQILDILVGWASFSVIGISMLCLYFRLTIRDFLLWCKRKLLEKHQDYKQGCRSTACCAAGLGGFGRPGVCAAQHSISRTAYSA